VIAGVGLGALAACTGGGPRHPHHSATPSQGPTAHRFPGDPAEGRLYFGTSVRYDQPLPRPDAVGPQMLRRTMSRRFYRPGQETTMLRMAQLDREVGILPFVSMKPPGTWASVAQGRYDDWVRTLIDGLGSSTSPVMFAIQHEPENDVSFEQTPAEWVAMQRHLIGMARRRTRQVTVVPVLMQYTFDPSSHRSPADWLVPDTDLQGLDVYNPWQPGSDKQWLTFPDMVARARAVVGSVPLIVPEYGCHTDIADPTRTQTWLHDAFDYSTQNNVVGLAYFDAIGPDGSSWQLDATGSDALAQLSRRPEVAQLHA
jgi:hypothetical protein